MAAWWERFFAGEDWRSLQLGWDSVEDVEDEAARVMDATRLAPGMRVVDAPCGAGRLAVALAERGCEVRGVDREASLLESARARATAHGVTVELREADIRTPLGDGADAVLCTGGSFGYFDDEGDLAQARAAAEALVPGGRYLIDTVSAETIEARFEPVSRFEVQDTVVQIDRRWNPDRRRLDATWRFLRGDRDVAYPTSVRVYTVPELTDLLLRAGFSSFEARDDALAPFTSAADRLWLVATTSSTSATR